MKTETNPLVFKQKLAEFIDSKQTGIEIYSDGSKDKKKVAAAAVIYQDVFLARLPDEATIQRQLNLLLSIYKCLSKIQRISQWSEIIYVKLKKKTRELSSKAFGLSFYLQKLYKINNVSYRVTLNNNKRYI